MLSYTLRRAKKVRKRIEWVGLVVARVYFSSSTTTPPRSARSPPAPQNCLDDGAELIVHDDNVGGILGDVGAGDAHRKANVGSLQRRPVVRSVARNSNDLSGGSAPSELFRVF